MKKTSTLALMVILALTMVSCNNINTVLKSTDREYKFEMARQLYAEGKYNNAALVLENVLPAYKNTPSGDEGLFLMGMCKYHKNDYVSASELFKRYYTHSYPAGDYVDEARFYAAMSYYNSTLPTRLDQSATYTAIDEMNTVLEYNPNTKYADKLKSLIFQLQDQLVEKEYLAATLYYNLGGYFGNCSLGGNNYQACITTAQNAVNTYPYSPRKEEFSFLILKAKYELAAHIFEIKIYDRFNDMVDEYYGFINEFPRSTHIDEAKRLFDKAEKALASKKMQKYNTEES